MLNKEQIMEILPHRPPMLLVDEIVEMDEEHVIGLLHLTGDEFFFQGHFPGNPIMPAMAKPGDTLRLEVHFTKRRGPMAVAEGVAWVGDQKAAEAEIKCMVIMD